MYFHFLYYRIARGFYMKRSLLNILNHAAFFGILSLCLDSTAETQSIQTINDPAHLQQVEANRSRDEVRESAPLERTITLPKVDASPATKIPPMVGVLPKKNSYQGIIRFAENETYLTLEAEKNLDVIVAQVQKEKPVVLKLALQTVGENDPAPSLNRDSKIGPAAQETDSSRPAYSSKASTHQDSAAGFPVDSNRSETDSNAVSVNQREFVHRIAEERITNIKQYLHRQGVNIQSIHIEGEADAVRMTSELPGESAEESSVQQIRIVVLGNIASERVGNLIDD